MEKLDKRIAPLLKKHKEGLVLQDIIGELRVPRKDKNKLISILHGLEGQGLIRHSRSRYLLAPRSNVVRGRLVTVLRGFGFVTPEGDGTADIFIPARDSAGALQGDTVEVLVRESERKGKLEGRILRILKKERKSILGVLRGTERRSLISRRSTRWLPRTSPSGSRATFCPVPA